MNDDMHYRLILEFDIQIAKWRIDNPLLRENMEWSLSVYDRNKGEWVNTKYLNRPGEHAYISKVTVIKDESPSRNPGEPTDGVSS